MKGMSKAALIATTLAAMGGGLAIPSAAGLTTNNAGFNIDKNTPLKNAIKQPTKAARLTSSGGYYHRFLTVVHKQSFKQNRRKELNASRKKRNKQF